MLLIHWTKQNNTNDIKKNGIKPTRRKNKCYDENELKGVWCFPFTKDKTLNHNWKKNLKSWRKIKANYNGFVFKLEESDFPILAGDWFSIATSPSYHQFDSYAEFIKEYGQNFSGKENKIQIDIDQFEIILPNKIDPERIVKILKDRPSKKSS